MEPNICVDLTLSRKLNFCSNEENKEKEVVPIEDNGEEKVINKCHSTMSEDNIPKIGMEFDSEEEAYNFYNEYAKVIEFGIRKHSMHKDASGRIIDRIFCCACQGRREKDKRDVSVKSHRPETRTGCCAMMRINGRYTRNYKVVNFIADHNGHDLVSPSKTHFLRSQRRITDVQAQQADDISSSGIAPKAGYYLMLKQGRPFALFVGVNHHKQTIVFGAALLYDETASTFIWLFDTFAKAMSGKQPKTILTDQDVAMAKALAITITWPNTCHRLCIWHIYQNAAIHLSSVFARFTSFSKDFSSCIYDFEEEEEFLCAWEEMLDKYELKTNEWLERMFKLREKWAQVYGRQYFCADMITTQRSESMNSVLKRYHAVASFPVEILKHAASVYTREVFELFQNELRKAYDSQIELCGEIEETSEYKITPFRKHYQHTVMYDSSQGNISCSCKKFEFAGILCSHVLKVLSSRNIVKIPEFYIKKRWTKEAKKSVVEAQTLMDSVSASECVDENEEKK
ncbi:UNVERIFIED_CONTAM: protein FAR1-RELATED SEQUENCE 5 [Sesamum angustifolium]|uniref:Protein FAR1-RELATED SEQUENCE n=1 Tax=Sesamum angustifolium TaxID=2727405 RepID=A0AAW2J9H4_9LAMI